MGNRWLSGKLGFQREVAGQATFYDEDREDFITIDNTMELGVFSHYVIDTQTQYMTFEIRPPDLRVQSFVGAFQDFLDQASLEERLKLEPVPDTDKFFEWLDSVEAVTDITISVRRANPNFDDRPESIREFIETTNSSRLDIRAKGSDEQPLQVRGTPLETFVDYADEGYGEVRAKGRRGNQRREFASSRNVRRTVITIEEEEPSRSVVEKIISAVSSLRQ